MPACRAIAPEAAASGAALAGRITLDGSSTLHPVAVATATSFNAAHPAVKVTVTTSGTAGGFKKLCAGAIDIAEASRPINAAESRECQNHGIEYIELPVAFDSVTLVTDAHNDFLSCLTVAELKRLWEPAADGKITRWNQIRPTFPAEPIALYGPGTDSGTFDYFTLAVVGVEHQSRMDYSKSEDDDVLVHGIAGNPHALGYFGYGYYQANKDKLKPIAVDGGHGCVLPSTETLADATYQPLTRPLFLYVSRAAAERPEIRAFAHYFLDPDRSQQVRETGGAPLPPASLLSIARRLDANTTGSVFHGRGSVLGVRVDAFVDDEKVRNALVQ
jgi:phosphate transport system substrate-binding protein